MSIVYRLLEVARTRKRKLELILSMLRSAVQMLEAQVAECAGDIAELEEAYDRVGSKRKPAGPPRSKIEDVDITKTLDKILEELNGAK